jgi:hypothetical protein
LLALTVGLLGLWAVALAAPAAALPSNCSQSGLTVTCNFSSTGSEQSWSVPAGVASVHIGAVGGTGGNNGNNDGFGGYGGTVSADVAVTGGSTLYIDVGGNGSDAGVGGLSGSGASGSGGGSGSGSIGGGGGGASAIQTCSASDSSCLARYYGASEPRLVVAGGGGGAGGDDGCSAGSGGGGAGTPSTAGNCDSGGGGGAGTGGNGAEITACSANGGGRGATPSGAGAGGTSDTGVPGQSGSGPIGGNGYPGSTASTGFGGGGGGGYFGGGGGGATHNCDSYGFGAGAGSSFAAGTNVTYGNDTTSTPSATITYALATPGTSLSVPASGAAGSAIAASSIGATLPGATGDASGTITFKVFGPASSPPSTCASGGTTVGTATVSGNGIYHPAAAYTPPKVGHYYWYASYTGDGGNQTSTSACGAGMKSTAISKIALTRPGIVPGKLSVAGRKVGGKCVKPTKNNSADKSCRRPIKLTVKYSLNGTRSVTFTVKLKSTGRKVGGKCVKPTTKNAHDKGCARFVRVRGKIVKTGKAGANHFVWNGKIGGRALAPGTYELVMTPAGGASKTVRFTIVG